MVLIKVSGFYLTAFSYNKLRQRFEKDKMRLFAGFALFAYLAIILYVSTSFRSGLPEIGNIDKLYHMIAYVPFGFLFVLTVGAIKRRLFWAFIVIFSFALFVEVFQYFMPSRSFSLFDLLASAVGGLLGAYLGKFLIDYNQGVAQRACDE